MGTQEVELIDVHHGRPPSRKRLLAPLRYLEIRHPEKTHYDFIMPLIWAGLMMIGYWIMDPKPALFGETGLLKLVRDLLIMAVPFMVGALAAVSMGAPGPHLDRRLLGSEIRLDGEVLTSRQFVCYLLGYLCFLGIVVLIAAVLAAVLRDAVLQWTACSLYLRLGIRVAGTAVLFIGLAALTVTVLWSLYFLSVVVNRKTD